MIIFFFHIGFLLKNYKEIETKDNLQKFFDFSIKQLELSIREIGYGDATINKKMKDYINLLFSLIDKIDNWEKLNNDQNLKIIKDYALFIVKPPSTGKTAPFINEDEGRQKLGFAPSENKKEKDEKEWE